MIALTTALEGVCIVWPRDGAPRQVPVVDFVTGVHANVLNNGELLRSIHLPASALNKRFAARQGSLVHLGRSAALLIGTRGSNGDDFRLTVTAATPRPVQLTFARFPSADELRAEIDRRLPAGGYFDDVNGSAAYKRHLTYYYGEQIRAELA
jgi:CO/xanthine dehydrogenase FAD-binding subunit